MGLDQVLTISTKMGNAWHSSTEVVGEMIIGSVLKMVVKHFAWVRRNLVKRRNTENTGAAMEVPGMVMEGSDMVMEVSGMVMEGSDMVMEVSGVVMVAMV